MNLPPLRRMVKSYSTVYLMIIWLAFGGSTLLYAHVGSPLSAPTGVAATININGTIDNSATEAVWGAGVPASTLPNSCAEFTGMMGAPVTFHALNDGVNLYLAFDIPDSSPDIRDLLFLVFDPNHGGGGNPAADDRALKLGFNNTAASDLVPQAEFYSGTGVGWSAGTAGLPPGVQAKYSRISTGSGKWQLEMKLPFTGPTVGFAFEYFNETGDAAEDCNSDGEADDFYAPFPATLTVVKSTMNLPGGIANPSLWGNIDFGPQPPTVSFLPPLCCHSADITFNPSGQPFQQNTNVNIFGQVHNLHASSVANNVNVEIRVHNFGTGGGVVFSQMTTVPTIAALGQSFSNPVQWTTPSTALHGCIRAEIKPPTASQYFIAANSTTQYNIDVACVPQGKNKELKFMTQNPTLDQEAKFTLMKQVLLPKGFEKMTFDLEQPVGLPPRGEREVRLTVTAPADVPITEVEKQLVRLPPTAGGTASPPLRERSGTDAISITVRPGDRLHFSATGEVDLDGSGPWPAAGPGGQNLEKEIGDKLMLGGQRGSQFAGALIGSFNNFGADTADANRPAILRGLLSSFLIGSESTVVVPPGADKLLLAVNDASGAYEDNTGAGFAVEISTLPSPDVLASAKRPPPGGTTTTSTVPQVNVTAVTTSHVRVGEHTYNLLTNHGGLVYQLLVVKGEGGGHLTTEGTTPEHSRNWIYWLLLALLGILVLIIVWRIIARKNPAS